MQPVTTVPTSWADAARRGLDLLPGGAEELEHTVARAFRAPATAIEIARIQAIAQRARRGALDVRWVATLRTALRSFTSLREQAILNRENRQTQAYQVEDDMANRQQRSNREKKKPKADKNKKKDKAPTSPFASVLNPASVAPGSIGKKT